MSETIWTNHYQWPATLIGRYRSLRIVLTRISLLHTDVALVRFLSKPKICWSVFCATAHLTPSLLEINMSSAVVSCLLIVRRLIEGKNDRRTVVGWLLSFWPSSSTNLGFQLAVPKSVCSSGEAAHDGHLGCPSPSEDTVQQRQAQKPLTV
mmetsp:Transcript_28458/g.75132  ORF Transcript_28458/g.75132 Transcript_28458/m.75132 type:complete len:151 (+) Transcript_28458:2150-2602(+)